MTKKKPVVTIIVPCYNAEKYLRRCVESVIKQTMPHWELMLIDDCSTDRTFALMQSLAAGEERIRLFKTPTNLGPGPTRNLGLDAACGKYLLFLDNDDFLAPNCLAILAESAENRQADVLCYGANYVDSSGQILPVPNGEGEYGGGWEAIDLLTQEERGIFSPTIWDSLILRDLVERHRLRFTPTVFEDMFFKYRLLYWARHIVCIKHYLYNHSLRDESLSAAHKFQHVRQYSHIEAVFVLLGFVQNWLKELPEQVDRSREKFSYRYFLHFALIWAAKTEKKLGAQFWTLFEEYAAKTFGDKAVYFTTLYDLYQRQVYGRAQAEAKQKELSDLLNFYADAVPELGTFRRRQDLANFILHSPDRQWDNFCHSDCYQEYWQLVKQKETLPPLADKIREIRTVIREFLLKQTGKEARQKCIFALLLYEDLKAVLEFIEPEIWPEKLRKDFLAAFFKGKNYRAS